MSTTYLDLTPFMWKLEQAGPDKLRLAIHCAPGHAGMLAQQLAPKYKARKKSNSTVVVRGVTQLCELVRRMAPDDKLLALINEYEAAYATAKERKKVPLDVAEERRRVVADIMRDSDGLSVE